MKSISTTSNYIQQQQLPSSCSFIHRNLKSKPQTTQSNPQTSQPLIAQLWFNVLHTTAVDKDPPHKTKSRRRKNQRTDELLLLKQIFLIYFECFLCWALRAVNFNFMSREMKFG
jgi:hypothetical protein